MRLLIMGAPGTGKGTYAEGIEKHFGIPHISTGEIFREAISQKTPLGVLAQSYIDDGHLVPDDVTVQIVKERIQQPDCQNGFVLDGFPRTLNQAEIFTQILNELNIQLDLVINLLADEELIIRRITNRRLCSKCGKGYNLITIPPKKPGICDDCGGALYQRKDDSEEVIRERLEVYQKQTKPLIDYYEAQGNIIHMNGAGEIDEVTNVIIAMLEAR
ncbi:MAG TPA: adenylate kinase [Bacilli bacterium]|jgi:adenylate kinase|nr:MAG: Adenylate kinase [Tenericutes bacterium ADurb.Bin140]HOE77052.1 adenylate kinase [Bacilli bacterium]HON63523.1 adenylate kinase [Bacilli bacterium]HOR96584.1 adenylate kinase [Bacilli bacterium]HPD12692.1 adenylate kinase [Bacilli bacterium]